MEGLWSGAWGGGDRDGVVFQPVLAEMFIQGEHVELSGFPTVDSLMGTVRVDASAKRLQVTPKAQAEGGPAAKAIDYAYEIEGDVLTLTDSAKLTVSLSKRRLAQDPLANAQAEFVTATGINEGGDLLVTEFTAIQAGHAGAALFAPNDRSLSTKQSTVLFVQETGLKKITIDEARKLIRESTSVVVAYRADDRPPPNQWHELWKEMGPVEPDSEAALKTFSRVLRPGTLVFILSARENVPLP